MAQEVLPTSWNAVCLQYTASVIDEVALGITTTGGDFGHRRMVPIEQRGSRLGEHERLGR
jgi:hypothetical protein